MSTRAQDSTRGPSGDARPGNAVPFALGGTREPGRAPLAILCDLQQTVIAALKNRLIVRPITGPVMEAVGVYEISRMVGDSSCNLVIQKAVLMGEYGVHV